MERDGTGRWAGFALDLPVAVWGKVSPEEVERSLARGLALALVELKEEGRALPPPGRALRPEEEAEREREGYFLSYVTPAPVNPVSLELRRSLKASGLTAREVARRMGTTPSAVSRLLDPFYFGHSLDTLRRFAEAVGGEVEVRVRV
ncbi:MULTISPECIES: type II toxin-antitoxin system HicB family antitoxin [Thermus]|uniref:type II toxin-antitoxin system HicB family antitoxin n=1 Tax=Thermus brockianus TaxID=56956 RepID=UPI001F2A83C2|nr:XRE family transcriptional regulator [Thermus brockianus]